MSESEEDDKSKTNLREIISQLLENQDLESLSLKAVRTQAEEKAGLPVGTLEKSVVRTLVAEILEEQQEAKSDNAAKPSPLKKAGSNQAGNIKEPQKVDNHGIESSDDSDGTLFSGSDDDDAPKARGKQPTKQQTKGKKRQRPPKDIDADLDRVKASKTSTSESRTEKNLKKMAKVMRVGPHFYMQLKGLSGTKRMKEFVRLLREKGAKFKGNCPTTQEIQKMQAVKDREMDLDGIDCSLIVDGPRRRRCRDDDEAQLAEAMEKYAQASSKKKGSKGSRLVRKNTRDDSSDDGSVNFDDTAEIEPSTTSLNGERNINTADDDDSDDILTTSSSMKKRNMIESDSGSEAEF